METTIAQVRFRGRQTFYPTYEEWKRFDTLLWYLSKILFILPMRNGNEKIGEVMMREKDTFYPTYEEWKLQSAVPKPSGTYTFYPTYEEWKPNINASKINAGYTFYPTYEEWKHDETKIVWRNEAKLFILPMRNGNLVSCGVHRFIQYPFYPTYEEWKPTVFGRYSRTTCKLFILPMRNGNIQ